MKRDPGTTHGIFRTCRPPNTSCWYHIPTICSSNKLIPLVQGIPWILCEQRGKERACMINRPERACAVWETRARSMAGCATHVVISDSVTQGMLGGSRAPLLLSRVVKFSSQMRGDNLTK
ncbi:hypothetical protein TNCV_2007201 [Trichonephila clavipes]|nr:hypothetical protein TNCV_2007201 [Trichonephila clavipes]